MKYFLLIVTSWLTISVAALSAASTNTNSDNTDTAASELTQYLQLLTTFSGQFTQTLTDSENEVLQSSSGEFLLKRPGYFFWDTLEPFPQLLVSNLETIWLYDPDLEQVTVREYDDRLTRTPALLLSGDVKTITDHYQVEKISPQVFRLIPITEQTLFVELQVYFEQQQLQKMVLLDSLEQKSTFTFINGIYNNDIDNHQFEFSPPAGTDIITGN